VKKVNDKVSILKQEEDSIRGIIINTVKKLNTSTRLRQTCDELGTGIHIVPIDTIVLLIMSQYEKLEICTF